MQNSHLKKSRFYMRITPEVGKTECGPLHWEIQTKEWVFGVSRRTTGNFTLQRQSSKKVLLSGTGSHIACHPWWAGWLCRMWGAAISPNSFIIKRSTKKKAWSATAVLWKMSSCSSQSTLFIFLFFLSPTHCFVQMLASSLPSTCCSRSSQTAELIFWVWAWDKA